jgi:dTDP-4-dehydrorhamnose 3,5-epimerase
MQIEHNMSYKDKKWNDIEVSFLKPFGKDVPVFSPSVYREYRGEIWTTYHSEEHPVHNFMHGDLKVHGRFSKSYKGVLRGLHWDNKTWKLVQALVGDIFLVVLDVRKDSPTYGDWNSYLLTEKSRDQVLVPPGFANGHFALTDCVFHYNLFYEGDFVEENAQGVVKWNDPEYQIEWPTDLPILQKRDR